MFDEKEFAKIIEKISGKDRLAGTKGEVDAFGFIKKHIKEKIGGKVNLQNYKILTWREIEKPKVFIDGKEIECKSVYYNPTSKIKGKLEYFGKDDSEQGNEFEVYCVKDGKKNVLAMFNVAINFKDSFYYNKGGATYLLPVFIVGSQLKEFFENNVGKETVISIKTKYVVKKSANLIHKISNRKNKFKLIIGAHVDTVPDSRGVLDNASGVATVLLLSEEIKKMHLPFDVWAVYFGSEENSMFGSKFFVDTLTKEDREKIKYMISVDGIGMGDKIFVFVENDYNSQINEAFKDIQEKLILSDIEGSIDLSDHYYFKLLGIDSCLVGSEAENFYCHNKEADDIKNLNIELSSDTFNSLLNFIKNIQFKSPNVYFDKKKYHIFERFLGFRVKN